MYINVSKYRIASRLRLSSHHLAIKTGRHAKPKIPIEQRFCTSRLDKIDDEYTFLLNVKNIKNLENICSSLFCPRCRILTLEIVILAKRIF